MTLRVVQCDTESLVQCDTESLVQCDTESVKCDYESCSV